MLELMSLWTLPKATQHDHRTMLIDLMEQVEKVCVMDTSDKQAAEFRLVAFDRGVHERDIGPTSAGFDPRLCPTSSATCAFD